VLGKFDGAIGGTIARHRWAQLTATVAELPAAANASSLLDVLAAACVHERPAIAEGRWACS
jgi:hypothetical protein